MRRHREPVGGSPRTAARLTSRLSGTAVSIVWAGAGCGKSTLATELREASGVATIEARLDAGDHRPDRVVGRLRRALRRAGRSDALAAMAEELGAPDAALEALADWLASESEPAHLMIDDVHNADEDSARLADDLPPPHRLTMLVAGPRPDSRRFRASRRRSGSTRPTSPSPPTR